MSEPLVSVIVPVFNGQATLRETLASVRAQTHQNLEILVVDDGSTDDTPAIAEELARCDARLRLIRQANAGVAAARNRGIDQARGEYVAPIDADDLWDPTKIRKQVGAMVAGGDRVGLVYTWYAQIDRAGKIISRTHRPREEGQVLERMCRGNLVGNGSAALMRTHVVREAGGYDPSLRAQGGQGCEDLDLYFKIAERCDYAVVPEHLTGYRRVPGNMSSDVMQMYRSRELVAARYEGKYPQYAHAFREGRRVYLKWLLVRAIDERQFSAARAILAILMKSEPAFAANVVAVLPVTMLRKKVMRRARMVARSVMRSRAGEQVAFMSATA